MIVRFVDISGIVDDHYLLFLFIAIFYVTIICSLYMLLLYIMFQ